MNYLHFCPIWIVFLLPLAFGQICLPLLGSDNVSANIHTLITWLLANYQILSYYMPHDNVYGFYILPFISKTITQIRDIIQIRGSEGALSQNE